MAPALVAGDAVPAGAALLGALLDRRAGVELAPGSLNWREGCALCPHGRKGYEASKRGSDDGMSASVAPPEAVCVTTIDTT